MVANIPPSISYERMLSEATVAKNVPTIKEAQVVIFLEDHNNQLHNIFNKNILRGLFDPSLDVILIEESSMESPEMCKKIFCTHPEDSCFSSANISGWDLEMFKKRSSILSERLKRIFLSIEVLEDKSREITKEEAYSFLVGIYCRTENLMIKKIQLQKSSQNLVDPGLKEHLILSCREVAERVIKEFVDQTFLQRQALLIHKVAEYSKKYRKVFVFAGFDHGDEKLSAYKKDVTVLMLTLKTKKFWVLNPARVG